MMPSDAPEDNQGKSWPTLLFVAVVCGFFTVFLWPMLKDLAVARATAKADPPPAEAPDPKVDPAAPPAKKPVVPAKADEKPAKPVVDAPKPAPASPARPAEPKFRDVVVEKPFAGLLDANPSWMDTSVVKLEKLPDGRWCLVCVSGARMEADTTANRHEAADVCENRMAAQLLAWAKETKVKKDTVGAAGKVGMTIATRIEGSVRMLSPVGRWASLRGDVFYVAYGKVFDKDEVVPK